MNLHLKEPWVLILVGPPLSGKSTWIRKNFDEGTFTLISRDQMVLNVYGSDDYNQAFQEVDQGEVDRRLIDSLKLAIEKNENVIIDMTHLTPKRRKYHLSFFPKSYYKVAVIFPMLSESEYEVRNAKRTIEENKTIPMHVIKNMISSYQPTSKDEGFNRIISI